MTDVVLFHHAQGLTAGVHAFADHLRGAGHTVTVPDLYAGVTFDSLAAGVAHARDIGMDEIIARGAAAVAGCARPRGVRGLLPGRDAGAEAGADPARRARRDHLPRRGAGLDLRRPVGLARVPLQLHLAEEDEWSEVEVARDLAAAARDGTLFVYPGSAHLTTESSLAEYQPETSALILRRSLEFLHRVG
nr:dienelactone hydrolase family protein [Actinoplanes digitatis]